MEIVLATDGFAGVGGSETYLLTVGEELQRLGHGVTIYANLGGEMSEFAEQRGLAVSVGDEGLPDRCDVVLVQDAGMAYALADRWPSTPQVFTAPSEIYDFQFPPQLPEIAQAVVVLSDSLRRRVSAMDGAYEVVRLRQPIDTDRLRPLIEISDVPRRALLLGNYLSGRRAKLLKDAWESAGVECVVVGAHGTPVVDPVNVIATADIVVGKARAALDGMACGRAVYIFDEWGSDGWVTTELYPPMEADNFSGRVRDQDLTSERLVADLDDYRPEMGIANRDLVLAHHGAEEHAHELVQLFQRLNPRATPVATPLRELARLVRLQWATEAQVIATQRLLREQSDVSELPALRSELDRLRRAHEAQARQLIAERLTIAEQTELEVERLREEIKWRKGVMEHQEEAVEHHRRVIEEIQSSRSIRYTAPFRRVASLLRRR